MGENTLGTRRNVLINVLSLAIWLGLPTDEDWFKTTGVTEQVGSIGAGYDILKSTFF